MVRSGSDGPSFDAAFAEGKTLDPHTSALRCRAVLGLPDAHREDVAAERS
jgi:hypothetical protein